MENFKQATIESFRKHYKLESSKILENCKVAKIIESFHKFQKLKNFKASFFMIH